MMKYIKKIPVKASGVAALMVSGILAGVARGSTAVYANSLLDNAKEGVKGVGGDDSDLATIIQSIVSILLYIVVIAAVIVIIISGIRLTTSAGDAQRAAGARTAIIYAIVGIVVAAAAYGIVTFVVGRVL